MMVCASRRWHGTCPVFLAGSRGPVLTPASPSHPHFSFLRTPRSVQFENGNPLFYLKLGSLALLHRKGDSLQTAVGAKFDYSAARTKAWVSAEDPLGMPDQRPAAL